MKTKWDVEFASKKVEQEYVKLIKDGELTLDDNRIIKKWVSIIETEGLKAIQNSSFWYDHELDGEWKGYRSSSFSKLGRIIYKVENNKLIVYVVRVTPDHNYRR
jgi:mRNA-degrading endonuclease YafQ of YafQ-DinJ toxin-antitoxin module